MGSEVFAFFLLPLAPKFFGAGGGWGTWLATVMLSEAMVLTTTMSRAASAVLHRIASSSYAGSKFGEGGGGGGCLLAIFGVDTNKYFVGGGLTSTVTAVGELSGAIFGSLAFMRFAKDNVVANQHGWPLDASLVFNISSAVCVALYFVSLTLHVNIVGDYGGEDGGGKEDGPNGGDDEDDYLV